MFDYHYSLEDKKKIFLDRCLRKQSNRYSLGVVDGSRALGSVVVLAEPKDEVGLFESEFVLAEMEMRRCIR